MKNILLLLFFCTACSDSKVEALNQKDVSSDRNSDSNAVADVGSDADLSEAPTFPDPDRVGSEKCEEELDCARYQYCDGGRCAVQTGCGSFGRPPSFDEDEGCIIDEFGIGRFTGAECESDDICPSDMPYCYLRACQTQPRCKVDSDCEATQFCDYETWCATLPPCESDADCGRGGCGENKICDYNG